MAKSYNITEVANILGMTVKTVRRFVASGELKSSKRNNAYIVSEDDLMAFKKYIEDGNHQKHILKVADSFKPSGKATEYTKMTNQKLSKKEGDIVNWADVTPYWNNPSKS